MGRCISGWWFGFGFTAIVLANLFGAVDTAYATATTGQVSPYLSAANSPLVNISALEDFEDGLLNVPGVSLSTLNGSSIDAGFSVDGDDGSIDGSGSAGKALTVFTQANTTGATFTFNNVTLGGYPKTVAIAVTSLVAQPLVFNAYDPSNAISATVSQTAFSTTGTSDDFLIWVSDPAGISKIDLSSTNAAVHMHLDHLQWDMNNVLPEPGGMAMAIVVGMVGLRRKHTRD